MAACAPAALARAKRALRDQPRRNVSLSWRGTGRMNLGGGALRTSLPDSAPRAASATTANRIVERTAAPRLTGSSLATQGAIPRHNERPTNCERWCRCTRHAVSALAFTQFPPSTTNGDQKDFVGAYQEWLRSVRRQAARWRRPPQPLPAPGVSARVFRAQDPSDLRKGHHSVDTTRAVSVDRPHAL